MKLIGIGFSAVLVADTVISILPVGSDPVVEVVKAARRNDKLLDASRGRKTQSVIILNNSTVVLSAHTPKTIATRFNTVMQNLPITDIFPDDDED